MQEETARLMARCACGWEAIGSQSEVVVAAQEHGFEVHNMRATRDEILPTLIPAEPAEPAEA